MFFFLHISLMTVATLGVICAVGIAMGLRKKKIWLNMHKTINVLSLCSAVVGIASAFFYVMNSSEKHLNGFHPWIGLAAALVAASTLFLGFYQFKAKNKLAARTAHRFGGRLSVLMFAGAVILGLKLINVI